MYCSKLELPSLCIHDFFGVGVYVDVFHDIIFYYPLTATGTLTFKIKWTPDVAFTGSFLDIVFGQYFRQEMGKELPPIMWNESVIASFFWQYSPWWHVHFVKNERLECEIKVT